MGVRLAVRALSYPEGCLTSWKPEHLGHQGRADPGRGGRSHSSPPLPQVWASDHHTELNLFCPLPPPCPIVQRLQTFKLFASAEWLPPVPPAGAWPSVTGLAVLRAGHRALWAGIDVDCGQQAAGGTGFCSWAPLVVSVSFAALLTCFVLPHLCPSFLCPTSRHPSASPVLCSVLFSL